MARRKSQRKSSSLPKATLDRARAQAGLSPEDEYEEVDQVEEADEADEAEAAAPVAASSRSTTAPRARATNGQARTKRKRMTQSQLERSKQRGELDQETIAYLLHNPTKIVSEEELHQQYGHVLRDLRNMFVLAGALMVLLVLLAQFI